MRKPHDACVVVVVLVVGTRVVLVVLVGTVGFVVDELLDVEVLVVEVLVVATAVEVVVVGGRVVLVGRVPDGRVVVVLVAPDVGAGHAAGAGALCATKRPGLSLPIFPPNRKQ